MHRMPPGVSNLEKSSMDFLDFGTFMYMTLFKVSQEKHLSSGLGSFTNNMDKMRWVGG